MKNSLMPLNLCFNRLQHHLFSHKSFMKYILVLLLTFSIPLFIGCGGGGSSSGDNSDTSKIEGLIEVEGFIEDGASDSPIGNAECRFVDLNSVELSKATANDIGQFHISVPEGEEGYIRCNPPDLPKLILSTYLNTENRSAGDKSYSENVTPATTVFDSIVSSKLSYNLSSAKENYLDDTAEMGEINIIKDGGNHSVFFNLCYLRHKKIRQFSVKQQIQCMA